MRLFAVHAPKRPCASQGFGMVVILLVLVGLSSIAAALARLSLSQQNSASMWLLKAQADQAALAGIDWGMYTAYKGTWGTCSNATQTLDLQTDYGMKVTVTCSSKTYNEGETDVGVPKVVRRYTITAVACNGAAATCPDNASATKSFYVETRNEVNAI